MHLKAIIYFYNIKLRLIVLFVNDKIMINLFVYITHKIILR